MKKKKLWAMCVIAFGTAAIFSSCTGDLVSLSDTSTDETQASSISDGIINVADEFMDGKGVIGYQAAKSSVGAAGPTVSLLFPVVPLLDDSIVYPNVVTIDFGTEGYTDKRDNVLKGKVIVSISAKMTEENSTKSYKLENFSINGNAVKGTKLVTYKGLNADLKPNWTIVTLDTITLASGGTIINSGTRTRTRTSNNGTPRILSDDSYAITGGSTGINAKGKDFVMTIDANNPLVLEGTWPYFVKGEVNIVSELNTMSVDYGDGTHDKLAVATLNGKTKEITLRK